MTLAPGERHVQLRYMLEHCGDFTEKLTEWERNFVESVSEQLDRRGDLSDKQAEILERIYCKLP